MAGQGNLGCRARRVLLLLAAIAGVAALAASPAAAMRSEKIAPHLCKTIRGGRFVPIPGFPGEKIDRRLLPDIRWMKGRYTIFPPAGSPGAPAHGERGEPRVAPARDIFPTSPGGGGGGGVGVPPPPAEPRQDQP